MNKSLFAVFSFVCCLSFGQKINLPTENQGSSPKKKISLAELEKDSKKGSERPRDSVKSNLKPTKSESNYISIPFEPIKSITDLREGSLVIINEDGSFMELSNNENDNKVIGVISKCSGLNQNKTDYCVAIYGKVKMRVFSQKKIFVGDLLISSNYQGIATKFNSESGIDQGNMHFVAKALEPFSEPTVGLISVLLIHK